VFARDLCLATAAPNWEMVVAKSTYFLKESSPEAISGGARARAPQNRFRIVFVLAISPHHFTVNAGCASTTCPVRHVNTPCWLLRHY